jgi:dihydrodipicolinate synthase/N-acetylneuraminate lyase
VNLAKAAGVVIAGMSAEPITLTEAETDVLLAAAVW